MLKILYSTSAMKFFFQHFFFSDPKKNEKFVYLIHLLVWYIIPDVNSQIFSIANNRPHYEY
jgi:hypothetical protein